MFVITELWEGRGRISLSTCTWSLNIYSTYIRLLCLVCFIPWWVKACEISFEFVSVRVEVKPGLGGLREPEWGFAGVCCKFLCDRVYHISKPVNLLDPCYYVSGKFVMIDGDRRNISTWGAWQITTQIIWLFMLINILTAFLVCAFLKIQLEIGRNDKKSVSTKWAA